jgi:hypothetical protein
LKRGGGEDGKEERERERKKRNEYEWGKKELIKFKTR